MRTMKLALTALLVVTAFSAVAAGSAWAEPEFVPKAGKTFPLSFTSTGGLATLNTLNHQIHCETTLDLGKILPLPSTTSSMLGDIHFLFHKCTTVVVGTVSCQSSGQPTGLIQTPLYVFHIGKLITLPNGKKDVLLVVLVSETTFECGGAITKVTGNLVGVFPELNAKGEAQFNNQRTNVEAEFTQTANGTQSFNAFEWTLPAEKIEKLELTATFLSAEKASEVAKGVETVEPAGETVELKA